MVPRRVEGDVRYRLGLFPAVAVIGPRQAGKTTLVRAIADSQKSVYLDLENHNHIRRLSDPVRYLASHSESLVVLDEVQRVPELFATLRVIIDDARRRGSGNGRFLLSGPASVEFIDQSGESLAGRIAYMSNSIPSSCWNCRSRKRTGSE